MQRSTNVPPPDTTRPPNPRRGFEHGGASSADVQRRLARVRRLAWLVDRSIPIGPWRIGLDPILGLIPGAGDWLGALLSIYVLYEGARLGVPAPVVTRMAGNILLETIVGAVPVLGDLFDFAWHANARNVALIERHYHPQLRPRSVRRIGVAVAAFALLVLALTAGLAYVVYRGLAAIFG